MEENIQQLRVISIFGFGGLGKTTLAMTIYQSLSAKGGRFQCHAFVTVSQRFDVKMLMRDILVQIIQPVYQKSFHEPNGATETSLEDLLKGMEAWDVGQLASMLRQQLENKIYLIVLDDVWSIAAWEAIRFSLPDSNNGSRILVTTRIRAVAHTCCFHEYDRAYEIEPLTDHESRDLFFKRIFGSTVNCPENLKEISEKILGKCGGAPLAIVSIAGLLVSKPVLSKDQWQKIYSSLGSELETSPSLERLKKILELSYNDLPYHLKTCFLYLSVYPEDHVIRRKSVLRRWVAERFVTEKRGVSVFEVAESYFDEFINRSIIHPVDMSFTGKVKTFRVHDVMLEIIVSRSIEENFITLVGEQHTSVPREKIRRLSVHSGDMKDIATSKMLSHVRSLSIFPSGETLQFGWMKPMFLRRRRGARPPSQRLGVCAGRLGDAIHTLVWRCNIEFYILLQHIHTSFVANS
jgi:RecA/RadA recombinase